MSVTYTAECTVLSNTEILPLCLYIIKQKQVMAQDSTNQDRALQSGELAVYIVGPRVREAERGTENLQTKYWDWTAEHQGQTGQRNHERLLYIMQFEKKIWPEKRVKKLEDNNDVRLIQSSIQK